MTSTLETSVRRSIVVDAPADRAFSFFTRDIGQWWDPNKHLPREPLKEMVFEPFVGGHIIDRGLEGGESRWGTVLVYDPPTRLAFSWDINLAWDIETDRSKVSEVHVSFTDRRNGQTLVELEHRHLDRHGPGWESMREAVGSPNGWSLEGFGRALAAAGQ
jgi:uncharacterized protein YndB with AHSA1/START domain